MATQDLAILDGTGESKILLAGVGPSNKIVSKTSISNEDGTANSPAFPLYNQPTGVYFVEPASFQTNSSLGIGANYTSGIENALSQPNLQLQARGSHAYSVTVTQYRDSGATKLLQTETWTRLANTQINENIQITGNYVQIAYLNTSGIAMTETMLYASLGQMPVTPDSLGQKTSAKSLPVVLSSDSFAQLEASEVASAKTNQYFVAPINPTVGTAVALDIAAATTFRATAPAVLIRNPNPVGGKIIIVKRVTLISTAVNTGGTLLDAVVRLDTGNRYTSGGAIRTAKSILNNSNSSAIVYAGTTAIVATAEGATTIPHSRVRVRNGINVAGDTYRLNFGGDPTTEFGLLSGTTAGLFAHNLPPLVIPPGGTALIHLWSTAQTAAPTYEGTIEFIER